MNNQNIEDTVLSMSVKNLYNWSTFDEMSLNLWVTFSATTQCTQ